MATRMRLGGMVSGMDTDTIVKQMVEAKRSRSISFTKTKTKSEWKQEAYQSLNKDLANFIVDARKKLGLTNYSYNGKLYPNSIDKVSWGKKADVSGDAFTATASAGAFDGSMDVEVNRLASTASVTGEVVQKKADDTVGADTQLKLEVNGEMKTVDLKANDTISTAMKKIKEATGLNVSFGKVGKSSDNKDVSMLMMSTKESGAKQSIKSTDTATQNFFQSLGVSASTLNDGVKGVNSKIKLNGKEIENESNNIDINGVQLTLKKADNVVNKVSVSADKDAIYDKIKEFVEGYNKIVKSMQDKVKEKAFRSYEPLTDTERKALSETEVKLWDEKAKSGLLNSDNTVSNILSNVRSGLYEKVEGAGSLFELGITTGTYQNGAVLQIDEKKLKNAIAKDPQKVLDTLFKSPDDIKDHPKNSAEGKAQRANTGVFVRVMEDMSNGITAIAKQSGVGNESSILQQVKGNILSGVVKNSSILEKSLSELTKRIDDENRKVEIFENNLWKKFSAMESAIQKMQSQTSWMNQQS